MRFRLETLRRLSRDSVTTPRLILLWNETMTDREAFEDISSMLFQTRFSWIFHKSSSKTPLQLNISDKKVDLFSIKNELSMRTCSYLVTFSFCLFFVLNVSFLSLIAMVNFVIWQNAIRNEVEVLQHLKQNVEKNRKKKVLESVSKWEKIVRGCRSSDIPEREELKKVKNCGTRMMKLC